mmetsp:Transcript_40640/g.95512  ORF Transcript_40640/g.95512 Transcript_40640/m.95512 type:complete len:239 (-) Transcript_40640:81-797(-)
MRVLRPLSPALHALFPPPLAPRTVFQVGRGPGDWAGDGTDVVLDEEFLDREGAAGDGDDGAVVEEGAELLGVHRRRHEHDPEGRALLEHAAEDKEEEVAVHIPLVHLIDENDGDFGLIRRVLFVTAARELLREHARGAEQDVSTAPRRYRLLADLEPNGLPDRLRALRRDALCDGDSRHPPWLCDYAVATAPLSYSHLVVKVRLWDLGGFATASVPADDRHPVRQDRVHTVFPHFERR